MHPGPETGGAAQMGGPVAAVAPLEGGEDERFAGSALRVPAGMLRDRAADVLSPTRLAAVHRGYFNRVRLGPRKPQKQDPKVAATRCEVPREAPF